MCFLWIHFTNTHIPLKDIFSCFSDKLINLISETLDQLLKASCLVSVPQKGEMRVKLSCRSSPGPVRSGPFANTAGSSQQSLWLSSEFPVSTHTLRHTDLSTDWRLLQIQAPIWPPLSRNQKPRPAALLPPLKKREGERRYSKVEHPQCLVLTLHWVCPITAVLSDWLCVGWWARRGDGALAVVKTDFIFKFMSGDKFDVGVGSVFG